MFLWPLEELQTTDIVSDSRRKMVRGTGIFTSIVSKKDRIVPVHSLKGTLNDTLTTVKLSFINDCPGPLKMTTKFIGILMQKCIGILMQ